MTLPFRSVPLLLVAAVAAALSLSATTGAAQRMDRAGVAAAVDSIVAEAVKGGGAAGLSVAVMRGPDTLVLKGYGFADLEHDVPTPDRALYEIGSVTKQFTAAAILRLAQDGKLALDDEITKFLPDYPTQGHRITLRRLLDHTSGIRGYTEMPAFGRLVTRRLPRDSLVALFSREPFDFAPGEALVYNNSAYFLLGEVIEKASGMPYAEYVEKSLFAPLGMAGSRYCSNTEVIKGRAHGYSARPGGQMARAAYLDHTWPYAAGSLCSTAGDLATWLRALHTGRVLAPAMYREMVTPGTLNDGTRVRYAKGLTVDSLVGHPAIHHGGAINGFLANTAYLPGAELGIVVLANATGPVRPEAITDGIVEAVLGRPESRAPMAFRGDPSELVGEYRGVGRGRPLFLRIAAEDGTLTAWNGSGAPAKLVYLGGLTFQPEGSRTRLTFARKPGQSRGPAETLRSEGLSVVSTLRRQ